MNSVEVLENGNADAKIPAVQATGNSEESEKNKKREQAKSRQKWLIRLGVLFAIGLVIVIGVLFSQRPMRVAMIQPKLAAITETITSSGSVAGVIETNLGAQSQGIVQKLFVDEGAKVVRGQQLALIKNDVAEAQILQAQAMIDTAKSQLEQVSRGALASDIDAAGEQVRQALAQVEQQRAAIVQAQKNVQQTRSLLAQVEAERDLAKKNNERSASLVEAGVVARSDYDQSETTYSVADKKVAAQKQAIDLAQAGVASAKAGLKSSEANVAVQQARLRTIQSGARTEDISVARRRIAEAERALGVSRQQAANAIVTAPIDGMVTKINTQANQAVGALGVLTLVSRQMEVRLYVDESNLSSLRIGQKAVISSGAYSDSSFRGVVAELGAAVDPLRGTIEIKVVPIESPEWLRPGQTVDVNIITAENVNRLLIPQAALARSGDETVVLVIANGKAAQKPVVTRPITKEGVPVLSGLRPEEFIVGNVAGIKAGDRIQEK